MAQNMAVSVTLRLRDQFTAPMKGLVQQLQGLTRVAQEFNRALGGTGSNTMFGRIQSQARALNGDVRQLANSFSQLGRAMGAQSGGGLVQGQIAGMRQLLGLQQQALTNNARLASGGGSGRVPNVGGGGFWGRRGFSPNASLADRGQYRAVNLGEQSLVSGFLDLDRARTALSMLATPRRNPNNPDQLFHGVITPETVAEAEQAAAELSQGFRVLNRAHILDTFREIVTQFQSVGDAFAFLPHLLNIQEWQVLQGDTVERARQGMLSLVRGIGLSGRLIGPGGELTLPQAQGFLDAYLRARMIGGADVNPDQAFQMVKYLKTTGQTISTESLLEGFIAMPDLRASTYGNQLNQFIKQLTGRATKEAQAAQQRAGWITGGMTDTASGPRRFQWTGTIDEEILRSNPGAWVSKHITGPSGYLRRVGIDPLRASPATIARVLAPMFSNQSAENIANMIVNQRQEWINQIQNAQRFNLTPEARLLAARGSGWHGLQTARSALQDVLGATAENFKGVLNPALESAADAAKKLARWIDPRTGSPILSTGVLAGGGIAALMIARNILRMMGPWPRMLIGGGLGYVLGGPTEALMGAMIGRGIGAASGAGGSLGGAAGIAGAAAGAAFGGRFMAAVRFIARGVGTLLRGSIIWGAVGYGITQIVDHWEDVKTRLLAIWADLKQAAPVWAGGQGQGWGAFAQGPAMNQTGRELESYLQSNERGIQDWLRGTTFGQWLVQNGWAISGQQMAHRRLAEDYRGMGIDLPALEADARMRAVVPDAGRPTLSMGPVTISTTINVATNADPKAIGDAAGNAVQSQLRGLMADTPPMP